MSKIIQALYIVLFTLTPLIFSSQNSEYFEIPKMHFVYGLTILILSTHLINWLRGQAPLIRFTRVSYALLAFYFFQLVSTYFSIDRHTSIFGYYSRLNGGLLSLTAYLILYFVLIIYINQKLISSLVTCSLVTGFLVSLYGFYQHFGLDRTGWKIDEVARSFSTLGQPNWLAAYLCILLPFALERFLSSKSFWSYSCYLLLVTSFWSCLLFTKSKSGFIAAIVSLGVYGLFYIIKNKKFSFPLVTCYLLLVTFSLTISNPLKDYLFKSPTSNQLPITDYSLLITKSEDIRKIVWRGAIDLWKQYPLFGTGPETFGYSYYWARPARHNLTSEWNYLYNRAHNEYLNYLATTGAFGFLSYLFFILVTCYLLLSSKIETKLALFSAFVSILITNSVGFSVVVISLYFFLLPALIEDPLTSKKHSPQPFVLILAVILVTSYLLLVTLKSYLADIVYASATSSPTLSPALEYRPGEPLYLSKLADFLAREAAVQKDENKARQSDLLVKTALSVSPFNLNLWKESSQTYIYLSTVDPKYYLSAVDCLERATRLAPTDAMSFYLLGKTLANIERLDLATPQYQKALELKSNFDWASFELGKIYFDQKKYDLARPLFETTLKIAPANTEAKEYLEKIK